MTTFLIRNKRLGGTKFHEVTRGAYKRIQRMNNVTGSLPTRTETMYVDGMPVKTLTLLNDGL